MQVTIEILYGPKKMEPGPYSCEPNIEALERAIEGKLTPVDMILLNDTISILEAIQKEINTTLNNEHYNDTRL